MDLDKELIARSQANQRGGDRIVEARGSVRAAFDALELGWNYDDVTNYLLGAPSYQMMLKKIGSDEHGFLQGIIMGFAIVAVEQSRLKAQ